MEIITSIVALGGVPLIVGLVEMVKPFIRDSRYYPLIAVGYGLIINLVAAVAMGNRAFTEIFGAVISGVMAGLAASGLYSAGQTLKGE